MAACVLKGGTREDTGGHGRTWEAAGVPALPGRSPFTLSRHSAREQARPDGSGRPLRYRPAPSPAMPAPRPRSGTFPRDLPTRGSRSQTSHATRGKGRVAFPWGKSTGNPSKAPLRERRGGCPARTPPAPVPSRARPRGCYASQPAPGGMPRS